MDRNGSVIFKESHNVVARQGVAAVGCDIISGLVVVDQDVSLFQIDVCWDYEVLVLIGLPAITRGGRFLGGDERVNQIFLKHCSGASLVFLLEGGH